MADQMKNLVFDLVDKTFYNKKLFEKESLRDEALKISETFTKRGILRSGPYAATVGKAYGTALRRIFSLTLEEMELQFKQTGRQDGTFFWNLVQEKLTQHIGHEHTSWNNEAVDFVGKYGGRDENFASAASRGFCSIADGILHFLESKIRELTLKAQFVFAKSPADRKANQIPDVAVMMWFPNERDHGLDAVKRSNEKYESIKKAVAEATGGRATVDKIDNPELIHKDRISPSVERWLEKSLLVICDLEENRPNVYYEFGYARASGTDVLAICPSKFRTDFHLAQWNTDYYENCEHLFEKLVPKLRSFLSKHDLSGSV